MKRFLAGIIFLVGALVANAAGLLPIEQKVSEAVKSSQITVVHFWATWCPNCKAELSNNGWSDFVAANPEVNFIFISTWDDKPPGPGLEKYGLGTQKNLLILQHPNPSRKTEDKMTTFMGLPVSWIPSTWIFREGQLRYAMNYGELHFPMLQQLVQDSSDKWKH
jgi:thiol-disulfide isomerase/thioredoxin